MVIPETRPKPLVDDNYKEKLSVSIVFDWLTDQTKVFSFFLDNPNKGFVVNRNKRKKGTPFSHDERPFNYNAFDLPPYSLLNTVSSGHHLFQCLSQMSKDYFDKHYPELWKPWNEALLRVCEIGYWQWPILEANESYHIEVNYNTEKDELVVKRQHTHPANVEKTKAA